MRRARRSGPDVPERKPTTAKKVRGGAVAVGSIAPVSKELRPTLDHGNCDVCGRSILKGERTDVYLAPGGQRKLVCELCTDRAFQEGWIRESAHDELPASMRRTEPRRSILSRFRRRRGGEE